jgi:phosphoglycerol transferase MdoB-like AlkP superfamily enzyme
MNKYLLIFKPLAIFSILLLLTCTVSRFILSLWLLTRFQQPDHFLQIFINGLRIDIALLAQLSLLPLLVILASIWVPVIQVVTNKIIRVWLVISILFVIFLEVSTPLFISQFDIRPNRLFIEYLVSPLEVTSMLINGFLLESISILGVVSVLGFAAVKSIPAMPLIPRYRFTGKVIGTLGFITLVAFGVLLARSGFQHRPINPAMVAVGNDRLVNSLALNSTYSVLYSLYQFKNESNSRYAYGELPFDQMIDIIKDQMGTDVTFVGNGLETLHRPVSSLSEYTRNKDLIIVVEESLGANFIQSLGGKPVTPKIETWRLKSWWFDRLYATGIRSARGLEALISGFLPTTSRAVLKLPRAQDHFFTLASYLDQAGYESTFIYGGESHFDNMKGFFLSNGFDRVIDQNDYDNPKFMGSWGVSDEDLFDRALSFISQPHAKPQFVLIFSSSNHSPYEFPDQKIKLFDESKHTALNAAKYSDYALGKFLDTLEAQGTFKHTTLLVTADHEDKVYGSAPVPIEKFLIFGFILDPDIDLPRIDKRLISQVDLAPTLISLLGVDVPHPMVGHDLTKDSPSLEGRAIMQFGDNQAYMTDDCIVYLQPQKLPLVKCHNQPEGDNSNLVNTAIAHAQFPEYAYFSEKYNP